MTRRLLAFFAPGLLMALMSCSPKQQPLDPPSITISNNGCIANCWNRNMNDVCKKLMDECGNRLLAAMEIELKRAESEIAKPLPRSNPRPRNGECPVCGTMAQPYKPSLNDPPYKDMKCGPSPGDGNTTLTVCTPVTESILPISRRIDCDYCNTTFRQWAEGKEPKR